MLAAGTYLFKPGESDETVVQIFNADRTRLYATLQTIAAERSITDEDLVITVAAPDSSNPNFLVKWFYPGSLVGHEFVYCGEQQPEAEAVYAALGIPFSMLVFGLRQYYSQASVDTRKKVVA